MFKLTQRFYFEAAHTLQREIETQSSRRIHGHTYHAEVTLSGKPDPQTGMLLDLGYFRKTLEEVRQTLDHHLLNDIPSLKAPTLENLCLYLWQHLEGHLPQLFEVSVMREASGDCCRYRGQYSELN